MAKKKSTATRRAEQTAAAERAAAIRKEQEREKAAGLTEQGPQQPECEGDGCAGGQGGPVHGKDKALLIAGLFLEHAFYADIGGEKGKLAGQLIAEDDIGCSDIAQVGYIKVQGKLLPLRDKGWNLADDQLQVDHWGCDGGCFKRGCDGGARVGCLDRLTVVE